MSVHAPEQRWFSFPRRSFTSPTTTSLDDYNNQTAIQWEKLPKQCSTDSSVKAVGLTLTITNLRTFEERTNSTEHLKSEDRDSPSTTPTVDQGPTSFLRVKTNRQLFDAVA